MKTLQKLMIGLGALLSLGALGYAFRWTLLYALLPIFITPTDKAPAVSAALDYADASNWAAHPDAVDAADATPPRGFVDAQGDARADVFFLHPTSYVRGASWTQPEETMRGDALVDDILILNQATAFNQCCRIFAPRYRQAAFYAFMTENEAGLAALDLAYEDVRAAFERYMAEWNDGRPVVIAGHSQGSLHGLRLLADYFASGPYREQLVAAYLPGYPIPAEAVRRLAPAIEICGTPDQTGCLASWNAVRKNRHIPGFFKRLPLPADDGWGRAPGAAPLCVNPISWAEGAPAARADSRGGFAGGFAVAADGGAPGVDIELVGAACVQGWLEITRPADDAYLFGQMSKGWHHIHEYALFWVDIRENAAGRVDAFVAERSSARRNGASQ